jgi:hypothetical protein
MIRYASFAVLALVAMFTLWHAAFTVGYAIAGTGSGSGSAVVAPADGLHDPVIAPVEAYDDFRAAQKIGWPLALLAALVMLTRGLATASTKWSISWLAFLSKGAAAVILAGLGTCGAAAFNTLALGGTWFAVATAAIGAALALIQPTPKAT